MTQELRHRGPDGAGYWVSEAHRVALGHRRLAVVDLSENGAQPMVSPSGRYVIVFNGEVYNFKTLRSELATLGCKFRSDSDTEVILHAVEMWGVHNALDRLIGMFAFGLWDQDERVLWLARDRMGEKPLYYSRVGNALIFSSELKALRPYPEFNDDVNLEALSDVLERGYIRNGRSIFESTEKVLPGELVKAAVDASGLLISKARYWRLPLGNGQSRSLEDATEELDSLLRRVVADQIYADVPVGTFLSGGIDSSLVAAIAQCVGRTRAKTFTVGFADVAYNEAPHALKVAQHLDTDHYAVTLEETDALRVVPDLPALFDEPFADSSALPTLMVATVARKHVTVALSGDGGDELFGGYSQYFLRDTLAGVSARIPESLELGVRPVLAGMAALAGPLLIPAQLKLLFSVDRLRMLVDSRSPKIAHESLLSLWPQPGRVLRTQAGLGEARLQGVAWTDELPSRSAQMLYDAETYLPDDILVKVDRTSMAVSLETRAPLLDHRVVQFAFGLPLEYRIADKVGKVVLRSVLSRYVPTSLVNRPKQGFAVPVESWLRGPLREWASDTLRNDDLLRDWFKPRVVSQLWEAQLKGRDFGAQLWPVLMIMQWLRAR